MIPISEELKKCYLEGSITLFKKRFSRVIKNERRKNEKEFLEFIRELTLSKNNSKSILTTEYSELLKIEGKIRNRVRKNKINLDKNSKTIQNLGKIFNYNEFKDRFADIYAEALAVDVCPYCNRNWTPTIMDDNKKKIIRCEFDHFLPKSIHPWFAVSLYNLVPICHTCNHKKLDKRVEYNPHLESIYSKIKFTYRPDNIRGILGNPNNFKIEININISESKSQISKLKDQINTLGLNELYKNFHNNSISGLIKRTYIHDDYYLNDILHRHPNLFSSMDELKSIVFGAPMQEEDIGKMPLGKLTYDILRELRGED